MASDFPKTKPPNIAEVGDKPLDPTTLRMSQWDLSGLECLRNPQKHLGEVTETLPLGSLELVVQSLT